jgi:hypothetical protein
MSAGSLEPHVVYNDFKFWSCYSADPNYLTIGLGACLTLINIACFFVSATLSASSRHIFVYRVYVIAQFTLIFTLATDVVAFSPFIYMNLKFCCIFVSYFVIIASYAYGYVFSQADPKGEDKVETVMGMSSTGMDFSNVIRPVNNVMFTLG